uniref:Ribosomal protein S10 n=1 Tax=Pylaiella littoralis TaxID=2885 RepID=O78796_PYLLI|nr:ribosomal protein S10 [Pylaiella littoralis]AAC23954.1 ribosomal protein S10 [Pylaiella littoralis]CAC50860.1 ribosomal protein S10 [Pylaiella littoralis]
MHLTNKKYICEVWFSSTNLKSLKYCLLLLPRPCFSTGLSTSRKRFTLLRSPLGNKTSKDQFERREYRNYLYFFSDKPYKVLAFLDVLRYSIGVKSKIVLSVHLEKKSHPQPRKR